MKKNLLNTSFLLLLVFFLVNPQLFAEESERKYTIGFYPVLGIEDGAGFGLFFEHDIKDNGMVSIQYPLKMAFDSYNDNNAPSNYLKTSFSFEPGLKFYFRRRRVTEFAVGPSLFYRYGFANNAYDVSYDEDYNPIYEEYNSNKHSIGVLGNFYFNLKLANNFLLGIDLGLGLNYLSNEKKYYIYKPMEVVSDSFSQTIQISLSFAYKF